MHSMYKQEGQISWIAEFYLKLTIGFHNFFFECISSGHSEYKCQGFIRELKMIVLCPYQVV